MIEVNPHRRIARVVAFICYLVAVAVFLIGIVCTLAAATMDMRQIRGVEGMTNARMTAMVGSMFVIWTVMIALLGWRIQRVFGQHRRMEKPVARAAVVSLRLGSLGCGLWALPTAFGIIFTGQILSTGEPAGVQDMFVGASAFIIAISFMLLVSWFIQSNFLRLNDRERKRAYETYLGIVQSQLTRVGDPEIRAHLQDQTFYVLSKLDHALKGILLEDLSKSNLLTGSTRIELRKADFRRADLCSSDLPEADLREINLEEARLEGALLSRANLYKARLRKSNLSHARLQEANLQQADLTEAVLHEAKLRAANLNRTILEKANLKRANLQGANLQDANLRDANLEGAVLTETDLRGADLTGAVVTSEQLQQARYSNGVQPLTRSST